MIGQQALVTGCLPRRERNGTIPGTSSGDGVVLAMIQSEIRRSRPKAGELSGSFARSGKDALYRLAVHVGQAVLAALELERQPFVVDAQAVENGGIQVVHMHWIPDDVVGVVVGFAVTDARLDTSTRQPHCEAASVMVSPVVGVTQLALAVSGATELAAPDDQRLLE